LPKKVTSSKTIKDDPKISEDHLKSIFLPISSKTLYAPRRPQEVLGDGRKDWG
jgi:hypothetical protein